MIKILSQELKENKKEIIQKNNNKSYNSTIGIISMQLQNAITLMSLVITIIILLILAGVTINLILRPEGLLKKTGDATDRYKQVEEEEKNRIEDAYGKIMLATNDDAKITISMKDLNTIIKNKIAETTPDYANSQEITFVNKSYTVENDGFIQLRFNYTNGVDFVNDNLFINEKVVYNNNSSAGWQNPYSPIFQVNKGDVITYSNRAQQVFGTYYPFR